MLIVKSKNNIPIRLTKERWTHIIRRHPEMEEQQDKILETISLPDIIQQGDYNELIALKFYPHTPLTKKYLTVVYKEINPKDGFVLTAYFTNEFSKRRAILWKQ